MWQILSDPVVCLSLSRMTVFSVNRAYFVAVHRFLQFPFWTLHVKNALVLNRTCVMSDALENEAFTCVVLFQFGCGLRLLWLAVVLCFVPQFEIVNLTCGTK